MTFRKGLSAARRVVFGALAAAMLGAPCIARGDDAAAFAQRMGRGVNILGYDGLWDGGVDAPFKQRYFRLIRQAGFCHVRINLHGFKYMDEFNIVDPFVLSRLDWAIEQAIGAGLIPVVDEHDFTACQSAPEACTPKLIAFWQQVAQRYAGKYPMLAFEILNEPGGSMTPDQWNAIVAAIMKITRTIDPKRTMIIGAINAESVSEIEKLALPRGEQNVIVTFHYYKPMAFTHQGAPWSPEYAGGKNIKWGTASEKEAVQRDFDVVSAWAKREGRPIYLGEFGVLETADMQSRTAYLSFVAREAEQRGWPWAYWQFDHDFALFDSNTERWVAPALRALTPGGPNTEQCGVPQAQRK